MCSLAWPCSSRPVEGLIVILPRRSNAAGVCVDVHTITAPPAGLEPAAGVCAPGRAQGLGLGHGGRLVWAGCEGCGRGVYVCSPSRGERRPASAGSLEGGRSPLDESGQWPHGYIAWRAPKYTPHFYTIPTLVHHPHTCCCVVIRCPDCHSRDLKSSCHLRYAHTYRKWNWKYGRQSTSRLSVCDAMICTAGWKGDSYIHTPQ